jgi:hypothetical protein
VRPGHAEILPAILGCLDQPGCLVVAEGPAVMAQVSVGIQDLQSGQAVLSRPSAIAQPLGETLHGHQVVIGGAGAQALARATAPESRQEVVHLLRRQVGDAFEVAPLDYRPDAQESEFPVGAVSAPGFEGVDHGRAPWQVVRAKVTVTIAKRNLSKATVLDANGNAAGQASLVKTDASVRLTFPESAMYVVVE